MPRLRNHAKTLQTSSLLNFGYSVFPAPYLKMLDFARINKETVTHLPFRQGARFVRIVSVPVKRGGALMTPGEVQLVQRSLKTIELNDARLAHGFYAKLFELEPETRIVFAGETGPQWRRLMAIFQRLVRLELRSMLTLPVTRSGCREISIAGVSELTERYAKRGGQAQHLTAAKKALLWSLKRHLGDALDEDTFDAWGHAYEMIAGSMIRIMNEEAVEPPFPDDDGRPAPENSERSLELLLSQ